MKLSYQVGDFSPFKIFPAASAIKGAFLAVALTSDGVIECGAEDYPLGLTAAETEYTPPGEDVNVRIDGVSLWLVGEEIHAGDFLSVGENGKAIKAQDGDYVFAIALEDATQGAIHVRLINLGFAWIIPDDENWDVVKIFFNFPLSRHRRWRAISYPHPREDLTREEIKSVGMYAVDNKLITNAAGEIASGVTLGALKRKEVTTIKL